MSWGSGASEGASAAGNTGSNMMSQAGTASSLPASMDVVGGANQGAGGYSMQVEPQSAFQGASGYEVAGDGTKTPVGGDVADGSIAQGLARFRAGGKQGIRETYNNFGNNPETYGAAYGLANRMAGSGKQESAPAMTTNINYQQPVNPYLQKRGRY